LVKLNLILLSVAIVILESCCPLTTFDFEPENTNHPGQEYLYRDFSGLELISTLKKIQNKYPEYLVPFNNPKINNKIPNYIYYNIDTLKYEELDEEQKYSLLIDAMGVDNSNTRYSFYVESKNIIINSYIFYSDRNQQPYLRFFCYSAYYLEADTFKNYRYMTCEQRSEITSIFEEEIISKLDSILKSNYPDRIIDWD